MKNIYTNFILLLLLISPAFGQTQSDNSDSLWSIVVPIASSKDIDMKQALVGSNRDSLIDGFILNTGKYQFKVISITFKGPDENAFRLMSGLPPFTVLPKDSAKVEFMFYPFKVGMHNAVIEIITQCDTIIQKIIGEGISPEIAVMGNVIDFGLVDVGSYKDTLQVATIKNIGSKPITVLKTQHNLPNDLDFTTLKGGGKFILNVGDSCKMDLRFTPSDIGRTNGVLEFYYDGAGSPAKVSLFGEGIKVNPMITASADNIPNQLCDNPIQSKINIKNTGYSPLIIPEMKIEGNNPEDFTVSESLPITIQPDSSTSILVNFHSITSGIKNAVLKIHSNAVPDSIIFIPLSAQKDSIEFTADSQIIDLGFLCPLQTKDTSINITNTGSVFASGTCYSQSSLITLINNSIGLEVTKSQTIGIKFLGTQSEGPFATKITIIDSICGYSQDVIIKGVVSLPVLTLSNLNIISGLGKTKDGIITLRNTGVRDVIIQTPPVVSSPFSLPDNQFPVLIPAQGTKDITISFTPKELKKAKSKITFVGEPCDISVTSEITGETTSFVYFLFPDTIATIGNYMCIPMYAYIDSTAHFSTDAEYMVEVSFDATLLAPVSSLQGKIVNKKRYIYLKGSLNEITTSVSSINQICGTILLADENKTSITIENVTLSKSDLNYDAQNGSVILDGMCQKDITHLRLIENFDFQISQNPVSHILQINIPVGVRLAVPMQVEIYSIEGILMQSTSPQPSPFSERAIQVDVSGIVPGVYFVKIGDRVQRFVKM